MSQMNWFTSDNHFGYKNIIKYCDRPFETAQEMDRFMIREWQARVMPGDHVFHLGDIGMKTHPGYLERIFQQLPGKIHFIPGNHDAAPQRRIMKARGVWVKEIWHGSLKHEGRRQAVTLCHYPMLSWSKSFHGAIQLFGHVHISYRLGYGRSLNVGVDQWGFAPVSFAEVMAALPPMPEPGELVSLPFS